MVQPIKEMTRNSMMKYTADRPLANPQKAAAAHDEDFSERPTVNVVAGRAAKTRKSGEEFTA